MSWFVYVFVFTDVIVLQSGVNMILLPGSTNGILMGIDCHVFIFKFITVLSDRFGNSYGLFIE